jgi:hypothetical protein
MLEMVSSRGRSRKVRRPSSTQPTDSSFYKEGRKGERKEGRKEGRLESDEGRN